jgi:hypothetical protein
VDASNLDNVLDELRFFLIDIGFDEDDVNSAFCYDDDGGGDEYSSDNRVVIPIRPLTYAVNKIDKDINGQKDR